MQSVPIRKLLSFIEDKDSSWTNAVAIFRSNTDGINRRTNNIMRGYHLYNLFKESIIPVKRNKMMLLSSANWMPQCIVFAPFCNHWKYTLPWNMHHTIETTLSISLRGLSVVKKGLHGYQYFILRRRVALVLLM